MSVTLTVQELANDMRVGPLDAETQSVLERELSAATILIERKAPTAPDAIHDLACIQLCAFWFDSGRMSNGIKFSGAWDTLRPYIRTHPVAIVVSAD